MTEINTKQELKNALSKGVQNIHINDKKLLYSLWLANTIKGAKKSPTPNIIKKYHDNSIRCGIITTSTIALTAIICFTVISIFAIMNNYRCRFIISKDGIVDIEYSPE